MSDCCSMKDFLAENKSAFGINGDVPEATCLNLCVQRARCTAVKQIRTSVPLPGVSSILNNCRGLVQYPGEIDTDYAGFKVTGAKETPVYCDTDRPGVKVTIEGQIVIRTLPRDKECPPVYIAFPVKIADDVFYNFYSEEDGKLITNLKDELAVANGSCMTVRLSCSICKSSSSCGGYVARIRGIVADKLWKKDSVWVEGIAPYPETAMTFCDTFSTVCPENEKDDRTPDCDDEDEEY